MGDVEERFERVDLKPDEFNGLIGNNIMGSMAGDFLRNKVGGGAGDFLGKAAGDFISGGGLDRFTSGGGGGGNSGGGGGRSGGGGGGFEDMIGGLLGGGGSGNRGGGGGYNDNRGSSGGSGNMGDLIGGLSGLLGGGGQRSGGGGGYNDGGSNSNNRGSSGGGFGDILGGFMGGGGGGQGQRGGGGGGFGDILDNFVGGGRNQGDGGGEKKKKSGLGGILGGCMNLIGGKKKNTGNSSGSGGGGGGASGGNSGGGGGGAGGFGDFITGDNLNTIIGGIGGLIGGGGNRGQYGGGGGGNISQDKLNGGMVDMIGNLIGTAAHRFLGVDPATGKIIGAVAGNVIFSLGGKDNSLGGIGKVVLDNIISGKFKRKVEPHVPVDPSPLPRPPQPRPGYQGLDFYALRDKCLQERRLFEDPEFPADDSSLFFSKAPPKRVTWLRPGEIVKDPQLIVEGQSRFDVVQGELGDCWLLAAAANLTLRDELFYRVCPPDQSFTENYAGIFHFQFWQYGRWIDVVIDDRLPTSNGVLLYMHSSSGTEFWSALLEKAYAKMHKSYESLKGGTTSEALEDFTGGLTEFYDLKQPPNNLLSMMMRAFEMGSLFGCSIEADPNVWEAKMSNGLVKGHAYSITGMRQVDGPRGPTPILRIRNPWGNDQEWNGAWSDNSAEWRNIPDNVRREMGLSFAHDGEFWMSFDDFMRNFEKMEICNLGPDVMDEVYEMTGVRAAADTWATNTHDGEWIRNSTAGGCRNFIETFAMNPQFKFTLIDSDPDDNDDMCTVILAVLQKYRRELRHAGLDNLPIGFAVYDAGRSVHGKLDRGYFQSNKSCARSPAFINLREMTGRFRLPPGNYVVVPSAFEPGMEGQFMMRMFTNGNIESEDLN